MGNLKHNKRRYYRFAPKKNTLAGVSFGDCIADHRPELVGLVYEEAYKGCGILCIADERFVNGARCIVECGDLSPTLSTIRWVKQIDENSVKIGVEYDIKDVLSVKVNK
ncbi:MAG: hypothetical protein KAG61_09205 [Bacteriovoracaceae bacterium]|nr:hypothetical protein [Bacteriovoracaceae bacterium]